MDLTKTLLVDIGNTNTKLRISNKDSIIANDNFDTSLILHHQHSIISCVAHNNLIQNFNNPILARPQQYKDIEFNYNLNELGIDRYLAIIAGYELHSHQNIIIIDIGTFITIEFLHKNKYISGGITPSFESLKTKYQFSGKDSQLHLESGISDMIIAYLSSVINDNYNVYDNILITGGGWSVFEKPVLDLCNNTENIIYYQNLVLDGLKFYTQYFLK